MTVELEGIWTNEVTANPAQPQVACSAVLQVERSLPGAPSALCVRALVQQHLAQAQRMPCVSSPWLSVPRPPAKGGDRTGSAGAGALALKCQEISFCALTSPFSAGQTSERVERPLDSHVLLTPPGWWLLSSTSHSIHWPCGALMLSSLATAPNFLVKSGSKKTSLLQERGATQE